MSRKFERQVERNAKKANAMRKRFGQSTIDQSTKGENKHLGRSWMLSVFLAMVGVFYFITFYGVEGNGLFWLTVGMYLILALVIFAFRRPILVIGKNTLTTRKFGGYRTIKADEIVDIETQRGYIVISLKGKRKKLVFSRFLHLYNTDKMTEKLEEFAKANQVVYKHV